MAKDDRLIELVGTIDEAQAVLGCARAEASEDPVLDELLTRLERDLWVVMAEVSTDPAKADQLEPGKTAVDAAMVGALEERIDLVLAGLELSPNFAVPGENRLSAALDLARTVVRRAERRYVACARPDSLVGAYLNRLSDLCWALARARETVHAVNTKSPKRS